MSTLSNGHNRIGAHVDDRPADGVFEVDPAIFTDPAIFNAEMDAIFARSWNFLTLETQLRGRHDFVTTRIGRTPVLVTRDRNGEVRAFVNLCRHKGAVLCSAEEGNRPVHVCPYHHWSYNSAGRNIGMKDKAEACYPSGFDTDDLNLIPVLTATHNGLIFGSLSAEVPSLDDYLGDVRLFIDLIMDQGPNGMEFIPGRAPYTFQANWKMQQDNGLDPYHVTSTHISLLKLQEGRRRLGGDAPTVRSRDWNKHHAGRHHSFNFPYGHAVFFTEPTEPELRPAWKLIEEIRARKGEARAADMLYGVQIHIFPNLQLASEMACIVRKFHPVAVDETEMEVRCLGAIGEDRSQRVMRLRQFEDFFNASGLASPDDAVVYENCQRGFSGGALKRLRGYSRGAGALETGPNEEARRLGIRPVESLSASARTTAEIGLHSPYREWQRLMTAAERSVHDRA